MVGPESVLPPGAFRRGSDILQHEVRCKISLMPEDAPGGNTDSGPDITVYQRIHNFEVDFRSPPNTLSG